MALSIDSTTNMTIVDQCESTTGWTSGAAQNWQKTGTTSDSREGTNCIFGQIALNAHGYSWYTLGTGVDMTDLRVYIWVKAMTPGTLAQGGFQVLIGDGTNRRAYYVGGSDSWPFAVGSWVCLMLDCGNLPANYNQQAGSSQPTLTSITQFGFGVYNIGTPSGNAPNAWHDICRYGTGIIVTSGASDEITLADIAADDASSATDKAYGIIREIQTGVYGVQGDILFGDTAGSSVDIKDTDAVVIFEDRVAGTGSNTKFQFSGQHSATGTFGFELGTAVGTGDNQRGRSGVNFINANAANQPVDFDFSDSDIEDVLLYGCTWTDLRGGLIKFSSDATNGASHRISGCTFSGCEQVDPGVVDVRNTTFAATGDTDGALLWNSSIDMKYCTFAGNTVGPAIEHPASGTFSYDNMEFSGNTNDIENSSSAVLVDSYQPTEDGDVDVYSGSITRVAQQFTATAGDLSRAIWSIRKQGSPTGDIVAVLYANSGGAPTGAALATSEAVDIAGLTTSFADVDFEFEDEFTLSVTDYHISIEYSGGDASNRLEVEYLAAGSGSETCNTYISSWGSQTYDCRFAVNRDGIVKINATDSNPGTATETATVKGATIIQNTVNLNITTIDKNNDPVGLVSCAIFKLSDDTELMNEDSNATTGIATEPYNYPGSPVDVYWRVRESPAAGPRYKAKSGLGQIDANGFSVTVTMEIEPVS